MSETSARKRTMRRVVGLILAVLGVVLTAFSVLLPTVLAGKLLKYPLSVHKVTTLQATNATYFSPATLSEQHGVTLQIMATINGEPSAGNASTAVWKEQTVIYDVTHHEVFQKVTSTTAFNRSTGDVVKCCGETLTGGAPVPSGVLGFTFPFGTQKRNYEIFDATLKKPVPVVFTGTSTVQGIPVDVFREDYENVPFGTTPFLGHPLGSASSVVTATEYATEHVIDYVDPLTGAPVSVSQSETEELRLTPGGKSVAVLDANLTLTPASEQAVISLDKSARGQFTLLSKTAPLVAGGVGGVLLTAGLGIGRRRRKQPGALGRFRYVPRHRVVEDNVRWDFTEEGRRPEYAPRDRRGQAPTREEHVLNWSPGQLNRPGQPPRDWRRGQAPTREEHVLNWSPGPPARPGSINRRIASPAGSGYSAARQQERTARAAERPPGPGPAPGQSPRGMGEPPARYPAPPARVPRPTEGWR